MRLLFDANLSPNLVNRIADLFPGSAHVFHTGLARHTSDGTIWEFAAVNGFVIVTADSDFLRLAESQRGSAKVASKTADSRPPSSKTCSAGMPFASPRWNVRRKRC